MANFNVDSSRENIKFIISPDVVVITLEGTDK